MNSFLKYAHTLFVLPQHLLLQYAALIEHMFQNIKLHCDLW